VMSTATGGGRSGSASTPIHVAPQDHPPVITAPATVTGFVNSPLSFTVTASDPDGDPITSLTLEGVQMGFPPPGMVLTPNANNTVGVVTWLPTTGFNGDVEIDAVSGPFDALSFKVVRITVTDRGPVVTAPATVSGMEGSPVSFNVSATDPDGQAITSLTSSALPFGATFVPNGSNTLGAFNWTPGFNQAGVYPVTFSATNTKTGKATNTITIANVNRAPVADAGGPYSGVQGIAITFNGTASSDPDGDPLTYAWTFGDATNGTGATPMHTYAAGGTYPVSLTVTDNGSPSL